MGRKSEGLSYLSLDKWALFQDLFFSLLDSCVIISLRVILARTVKQKVRVP